MNNVNDVNTWSAGRRRFTWRDPARDRPVWADVWFPAAHATDGPAPGGAFPIVVMSHGASGAAENYSWIAGYLARHGAVVLGVSHYRESWLYGPETIDPGAVTRLWDRPGDCTFALSQLLTNGDFAGRVDPARIGAIGHSSGGAPRPTTSCRSSTMRPATRPCFHARRWLGCGTAKDTSWEAVHAGLAPQILAFFMSAMPGVWIR